MPPFRYMAPNRKCWKVLNAHRNAFRLWQQQGYPPDLRPVLQSLAKRAHYLAQQSEHRRAARARQLKLSRWVLTGSKQS